jgi:hypothetical protein
MGAFLTTSSQLQCPHGGMVSIASQNSKAKADGAFIARSSDTFSIAGCAFVIAGAPHPCVRVQWLVSTQRNQAAGGASLAEDSVGLCLAGDSAPQGTVVVASTQAKAKGL